MGMALVQIQGVVWIGTFANVLKRFGSILDPGSY